MLVGPATAAFVEIQTKNLGSNGGNWLLASVFFYRVEKDHGKLCVFGGYGDDTLY